MIALRFELLAGRYHATPWDAHVNEGQVEWPPSPWRILRALVAASFRLPDRDEAALRTLILALADVLPAYQLPPVTLAHTRAYLAQQKPGEGKLVFDAFAVAGGRTLAPDSVYVMWGQLTLPAAAHALLTRLVGEIGYLGRAESWVQASVVDSVPPDPTQWVAFPDADGDLSVWCVSSDAEFSAWRAGFLAAGGKPKDAPASRYAALVMETGQLQKERWSAPPSLRRVPYRLERGRAAAPRAAPPAGADVHVARFALVAKVLPGVGRSLSLAERLRSALMSPRRHEEGRVPQVFSGRADDGSPMEGNRHAYFLPCDDDGDGALDHLLVWAPMGFGEPGALRAIQTLRHLWAEAGVADDDRYLLSLVGLGARESFGTVEGSRRHAARTAVLGRSRVWVSETPFVPFRHAKARGGVQVDGPADQLRIAVGHLPHLAEGGELSVEVGEDASWSRAFLLTRKSGGGSFGGRRGYRAVLRFAEPVTGPVALGYGAHFGLGLFRASAE